MADHEYGQFDSWEIVNENIARKTCDSTIFYAKESDLPQSIRWFFRADSISFGRQLDLLLIHDGIEYQGYVKRTYIFSDTTTISLGDDLIKKFQAYNNEKKSPVIEFKRLGDRRYAVRMINSDISRNDYNFNKVISFLDLYSGMQFIDRQNVGNNDTKSASCIEAANEASEVLTNFAHDVAECVPEMEFDTILPWITDKQTVSDAFSVTLENAERKDDLYNIDISVRKAKESDNKYILVASISIDFKRYYISDLIEFLNENLSGDMFCEAFYQDREYSRTDLMESNVRVLIDKGPINKAFISIEIEELEKNAVSRDVFYKTVGFIKDLHDFSDELFQFNEWMPPLSEYDPGISAEQYETILRKGYTGHAKTLATLFYLYKMGGSGTCAEIADKYGGFANSYAIRTNGPMQYVAAQSGCPVHIREDNSRRMWAVLFLGKDQKPGGLGGFIWKLREPLKEAIGSMIKDGFFDIHEEDKSNKMNVNFDHNLILYGPPGTGKTYNSVNYAVAICDGRSIKEVEGESYQDTLVRFKELEKDGRIVFTTFHQSYGYEEFIEGIKPVMANDDLAGQLHYEIQDGIFKRLCKAARTSEWVEGSHNASIWFVRLEDSKDKDFKKKCFDEDVIRFVGPDNPDDGFNWEFERLSKMKPGDYVLSYGGQNTYIDGIGVVVEGDLLYEPEKTSYLWDRKVKWLLRDVSFDVKEINDNHDLPKSKIDAMTHLKLSDLYRLIQENGGYRYGENPKPYVFIIDEINRGNISKIFGELITLIEETKRAGAEEAMEAILPYSGESFSVPSNVYILGTMNTADRSIALMDTALRRRFKFAEMMPNSEVLSSLGIGTITVGNEELNIARMLDIINERIEFLFDREHTIGHAFFTKLADDPSIETLADIFEKNVIPLLQEYFYEDYEKIQLVLGDNSKADEFKFILDREVKVKNIFNGNPDIDLPERGYTVQHKAFRRLESYKQIGKGL